MSEKIKNIADHLRTMRKTEQEQSRAIYFRLIKKSAKGGLTEEEVLELDRCAKASSITEQQIAEHQQALQNYKRWTKQIEKIIELDEEAEEIQSRLQADRERIQALQKSLAEENQRSKERLFELGVERNVARDTQKRLIELEKKWPELLTEESEVEDE